MVEQKAFLGSPLPIGTYAEIIKGKPLGVDFATLAELPCTT
jgi:hypothetical protein